jgi:outer membrane receptor protein involved in Fe transport
VLILIDGRPIREVQEGGVSSDVLESFPVNIIERIEVIKGPGSVLYGSDAFSAVVNIIPKSAKENGLSVTGLAQSGGGVLTFGDVTYSKGDFSLVAAGRFMQKTEWETTMKAVSGTDSVTGQPVIGSIDMDIPNKGPGAFLGLTFKNLKITSSYNKWSTYRVSGLSYNNVDLTKYFTNAGYSHSVNENWDMDFNITYTKSELLGEGISQRDNYNLVAEWSNAIRVGEKTKLMIGGLFNKNSGTEKALSTGLVISEGDVNSYAGYAQLDYQALSNLKLIGGMQANKVDEIDLDVVPRGGLIWYPVEKVNVKALYSQAFRAPSINEVNMNFLNRLLGNPNIGPEKVATFDLSIGYHGEQSQLGVNVFRSSMTDIIQIAPNDEGIRMYQNNQDVVFVGAELEGKYYINSTWYLTGSTIYQKSKNDDDDIENLSPIADFGFKAGISYAKDGISVGLFNIYQGDLDEKYMDDINPNQGAYNLLHLHSSYDLNQLFHWNSKQNITLIFKVDNLLDEEHFGFNLGGTSGSIPSWPGRQIYVGLNAAL